MGTKRPMQLSTSDPYSSQKGRERSAARSGTPASASSLRRRGQAPDAGEGPAPRPKGGAGHAGGPAAGEPEECRDREHQRDVAARGAELGFESGEEGGEGVGRGEADEHQGEGRGNHPPAVA